MPACHNPITDAARTDEVPVRMITPPYLPVPKRSTAVGADIRAALIGLTRMLPTPCRKTKMENVETTVDGSSLTARPMATRSVPKPKLKKPYTMVKRMSNVMDLPRPQRVKEDTAPTMQHIAAL